VVWGSTFVTKMMERWPLIAAIGSSILALTGAGMVVKDPLFDQYVMDNVVLDRALQAGAAIVMFLLGWRAYRRNIGAQARASVT
jgi:predicted tellurium resistance membrane protein TerC